MLHAFRRSFTTSAVSKPLFVSVEGNIGAGKTSLVNAIAKHTAASVFHEPLAANPYLSDFYASNLRLFGACVCALTCSDADPKKYALKTQLWMLKHRFSTYQNALSYLDDGVVTRRLCVLA
jgi:deoxyadenosine/deoxycytidine kinase